MVSTEVIRRVTVEGRSQGVEQATAKVRELGKAQDGLARTSETSSRATLTVSRALERLQRNLDQTYREQQQLIRVERDLDRARQQGLITVQRQNQLMEMARQRYTLASGATTGLTTATAGLEGRLREAASSVALFDGPLGGVASRLSAMATLMTRAGGAGALAAVGIGALSFASTRAVSRFKEFETQALVTEQVLRATGSAAGRTSQDIEDLARSIGRETLASTAEVRQAAAQLLTFRSIAGQTFDDTLRLSQDLATVGFGTLSSSALQLAKALEDPEQGLSALRRVGVSFSLQQREMIKDLMESGRQFEAQRVIIDVVRQQVGGAGAAAGGGLAGAYDGLGEAIGRASERIGEQIVWLTRWQQIVQAIQGVVEAAAPAGPREELEAVRRRIELLSQAGDNVVVRGFLAEARAREQELTELILGEHARRIAAVRQSEQAQADAARDRVDSVISGLNREMEAARQTQVANAILEAQRRAGVDAASLEGQEIARLVTQMHAEKDAREAAAKASQQSQAAYRAGRGAVENLITSLQMELDILREQDPVMRQMIQHREALAWATEGEQEKVRQLIETRMRETEAIQATQQAQDFLSRTAYTAFSDLVRGAATFEQAMLRLADAIAEAVLQAALLGSGPLAGLFGSSGGGGLIGSLIGSLFGGATGMPINLTPGPGFGLPVPTGHTGGIVGASMPGRRMVDPMVFAAAPRMHTGGRVPGLRPREVPIIAEEGERIIPRGASGGPPTIILNNAPAGTEVEDVRSRSDGGMEIDLMRAADDAQAERIGQRGASARAMERFYGLNPTAGAPRRRR